MSRSVGTSGATEAAAFTAFSASGMRPAASKSRAAETSSTVRRCPRRTPREPCGPRHGGRARPPSSVLQGLQRVTVAGARGPARHHRLQRLAGEPS